MPGQARITRRRLIGTLCTLGATAAARTDALAASEPEASGCAGGLLGFDLFQAPNPIEKVSFLRVLNYPTRTRPLPDQVRFADVFVPGCRADDVIFCSFTGQVSTKLRYNVELSSKLVWTMSPAGIDGQSFTGRGGQSTNITRDIHHGIIRQAAALRLHRDGDGYVAAIVYAGGGSYTRSGDQIEVNIGYGSLDVMRFRVCRR